MNHVLFFAIALVAAAQHTLHNGWGPAGVKQVTGYIDVPYRNSSDVHLFFQLYESQSNPATDPLLIFLSGGPGCSSMLAAFAENGPLHVNLTTGAVYRNVWAWNANATLLFIDTPVGTGFSFTDTFDDYVFDEREFAAQMIAFMRGFYSALPQYAPLDLFVSTESFGGHYGPSFGRALVENKFRNFRALAVGNGWVHAARQYASYIELADLYITSAVERAALHAAYDVCALALAPGSSLGGLAVCFTYMEAVSAALSRQFGYSINPYDIKQPCTTGLLCYNFTAITTLLNDPSVQAALGVKRAWQQCSSKVFAFLLEDQLTNLEPDLVFLLAAGVRVVLYSGADDFICNQYGTRDLLAKLAWPGLSLYNAAPTKNVGYGTAKSTRSASGWLDFVIIANSSHMVPMTTPAAALAMISSVLSQKPF